jgi:two-component system cell cycle response regulator
MLEGNGYLAITAENGQEALDKLKTENIDAIISDVLMPEMDGFQLCRAMKEEPGLSHILFIIYTGAYNE